jgi:NADPH2:quinone reductase
MCRGLYQVKRDLPFNSGVELCGEVVVSERLPLDAVAEGVHRLADGASVGRVVYAS